MADDRPLINLTGDEEKSDISKSINTMLDTKNINLTTEIDNPLAMSVLEVMGEDSAKRVPQVGTLLVGLAEKLKRNFVPFKRGRANELIQMADAASGAARDREKGRMRDKLLGDLA